MIKMTQIEKLRRTMSTDHGQTSVKTLHKSFKSYDQLNFLISALHAASSTTSVNILSACSPLLSLDRQAERINDKYKYK